MPEASPNTHTAHAAPRPLWRAMRAFLCLLFDLFGEPDDIAARGVLDRRARALVMPWLRAGEAFLRRLLLIEALSLAPDLRAAQCKPRVRAPRARRLLYFYPDKPDDWRVSFRLAAPAHRVARSGGARRCKATPLGLPPALCMPKPPKYAVRRTRVAAPAKSRPQHAPRDPNNAWPVAERFEAMLRAYNAPQRSARRLARLLLRDEARALGALDPTPAPLTQLFGAQTFARCNAIVASRRRRRDRQTRRDTS